MAEHHIKKKGVIKALCLILFVVVAIYVLRVTPIKELITPEMLKKLIRGLGIWGPIAFICIYATGVCLFLPASLFIGIGAVLFDTGPGLLYNVAGAMVGATISFLVARYLGREFSAGLIGDRFKKYDNRIAANGFTTTLYIRLIFSPFSLANFGLALTQVGFWEFFVGTFFGIFASSFIMTFFFASLAEVWSTGERIQMLQLLNWKTLFAVILFIGSFFIPRAAKKLKLLN